MIEARRFIPFLIIFFSTTMGESQTQSDEEKKENKARLFKRIRDRIEHLKFRFGAHRKKVNEEMLDSKRHFKLHQNANNGASRTFPLFTSKAKAQKLATATLSLRETIFKRIQQRRKKRKKWNKPKKNKL
ncbi:hypothetical protein ACFL35_07765 [Candidatus Riflebacteria bacterium]